MISDYATRKDRAMHSSSTSRFSFCGVTHLSTAKTIPDRRRGALPRCGHPAGCPKSVPYAIIFFSAVLPSWQTSLMSWDLRAKVCGGRVLHHCCITSLWRLRAVACETRRARMRDNSTERTWCRRVFSQNWTVQFPSIAPTLPKVDRF